jgi:hypothetical protein
VRNLDTDHGRKECAQKISRKFVSKIHGPVRDGERLRIRTDKDINDTLTRGKYCKIDKILLSKTLKESKTIGGKGKGKAVP